MLRPELRVCSLGLRLLAAAVQESEEKSTITFGDLRSAPNCHPECSHGCTESNSSTACYACKHFTQSQRNRNGFRCVDHCDEAFYAEGDKCKKCSTHCQSCSEAEVCITCHGAKLLVDVQNHYGHFDHGKCVDACPYGLVPDYSHLVQARCVIKKNPCSAGYYESIRGCLPCDNACSLCHGPGVMACDQCAVGYGNKTMGFCRPCCKRQESLSNATTVEAFTELPPSSIHQCEVDCQSVYRPHNDYWGANNDYWSKANDAGEGGFSLLARFVLVTGGGIITTLVIYFLYQICCFPRIDGDTSGQGLSRFWRKNVEYTPLKTAEEGRRFPFEDDTSSSDEGESYELCPRGTLSTSAQTQPAPPLLK